MSGKKITGRTKQLSLKSTPKFHQRLKELATKKKCLMIEILERAMELYERKRTSNKIVKENIQLIRNKITKSNKRSRDDEQEEQQNINAKKRKFNS